jgi:NTP pyrophosphatase (non-canonical NTP hydrolase)
MMKDENTVIETLKEAVRTFARERDWGQFHSPKNLAMGLAIESAELMEHFLWKTQKESEHPRDLEGVARELADVFIFTLNLASRLGIDLASSTERKLEENARKYPADLARGKALKHTHYRQRKPPAPDGDDADDQLT